MRTYLSENSRITLLNLLRTLPKNDFYSHKLSSFKLQKKSRLSLTDFYKLPFTTRDELYSFQTRRTNNNLQKSFIMHTKSRSLEDEIQLPLSSRNYQRMVAFERYRLDKSGVEKSDICSIVHFPLQHIIPIAEALMSIGATFIPIDGSPKQVFTKILGNKLTVLICTPSTVNDLINFTKKSKKRSNLRLIITAGQEITNFKKFSKGVKQSLGADVKDQIGSSELQIFAIRCRQYDQYHFIDKDQVVEIINPETLQPAREGELVITPLWRQDFPLIRYRTGDYVKLQKRKLCSCTIKDPRVFSGVIKRVDNMTKINGVLASLEEVYEKMNHLLHFQYPTDTLLWRIFSPPKLLVILDEDSGSDQLLVYVDRMKYRITLRRKKPIEHYLKSMLYLTPKIILNDQKESRQLGNYHYLDIRGQKIDNLPYPIKRIKKKYKKA